MKFLLFSTLILFSINGYTSEDKVRHPTQEATKAAMILLAGLKSRLTEQMTKNGPLASLDFCSTQATTLTQEFQEQIPKTWHLKRISDKNRNPDNAPDKWDQNALDFFADKNNSQKDFVWIEETDSKGVLLSSRFYKPIRLEANCLLCHGAESSIQPPLKALLNERYPQDKALGYRPGDLRGFVRVLIPNSP